MEGRGATHFPGHSMFFIKMDVSLLPVMGVLTKNNRKVRHSATDGDRVAAWAEPSEAVGV